ncbi:GntR family transcriptional regulator [Brevibacterium gallinarum]|uniref:GntR family transcriptional regulator n=1 Tax=Brevibacterium gallinarum TaxID=2762220 RepID=A0ABR8WW35_9MICO|nr:GntR family transcriptional regulator [Brevibacterium gallinarum]MBD8020936.1 GntR family transcriptional regulator [Brevibacterium gallinarum]
MTENYVSAPQRVMHTLLDEISTGMLQPGEKLNEMELAARLDVSRNTLREAFISLQEFGVVARRPHRGVCVTLPETRDVDEIYQFRSLLEPAALQWSERLDAALLTRCVEEGRAAMAAGDPHGTGDANQRFHSAIIASANSVYADAVMVRVLALMRLVFIRGSAERHNFHFPYVELNAAIAQLAVEGRRVEAAAEMRAYLQRARADVRELLARA